jgi:hypothetical protein
VSDLKDEIIFKVWDEDLFIHDAIGLCNVKINSLCINGGGQFEFSLYYGQEEVGVLTLVTNFSPSCVDNSVFDSEITENKQKELELRRNILNQLESEMF